MRRGFLEIVRFRPAAEWIGWPLLLFVITSCYLASYATHRDLTADEGWQLDCALRILDGQIQHRDFGSVYTAGRHYLFAGLLAVTGKSLLAIRLTFCLLFGISVGLVFAVGRRLMPVSLAGFAAFLVMVVPGPWHKAFYSLILLLGVYALMRWRESGLNKWLVVTGVVGGLGAWFRQDNGLFVLIVGLALIVLWALARRGSEGSGGARRVLVEVASLLLPAVCLLLGVFAFFAFQGAGSALLTQVFGVAIGENAPRSGVAFDALELAIPGLLPFVMPLLSLPVLVWSAFSAWRRRALDDAAAIRFCLALCCLFAGLQVFRFDVLLRFLQSGPLVYLLGLALAWRLAAALSARPWASRVVVAIGVALPLLLSAMALFDRSSYRMPVEYSGTIAVRFERREPVDIRGVEFQITPRWANQLRRLTQFVEDSTEPGEPLLVLGKPSSLYFLTDRLSPLSIIRPFDRVVARAGRREIEQTLLDSSCRFVVEDLSFTRRRGKGWRRFIKRHGKLVGRVGKLIRVWEIERQ
ncbi:MAG: hypothetical protein JRF63_11820 [Deltaproteobacteria bacterium]|nr:hypothetical protein [Deltaproteobacteria bacterium]